MNFLLHTFTLENSSPVCPEWASQNLKHCICGKHIHNFTTASYHLQTLGLTGDTAAHTRCLLLLVIQIISGAAHSLYQRLGLTHPSSGHSPDVRFSPPQ